jgi:hypothetical protein
MRMLRRKTSAFAKKSGYCARRGKGTVRRKLVEAGRAST